MITKPPFCPDQTCPNHLHPPSTRWYSRDGTYHSQAHGEVPRFICTTCGKQFSAQTFSLDYQVKRKVDYHYIFNQLKSTAGIRHIARDLDVSVRLILNRITRLAHQALAVHRCLCSSLTLSEDLVADGFESFLLSQYFPNNINLLVGKDSQFLYAFDFAPLRRKGRMTEQQKRRREALEEHYRAPPHAIFSSFLRILDEIEGFITAGKALLPLTLFTDEHATYPKALRSHSVLAHLHETGAVEHRRVNSTVARTRTNQLFAVNYYDRELRKDNANHVRETVQFSRNAVNCMERMAVYRFYHNYRKPYRIGRGEKEVHAERAGISKEAIRREWKSFFTRRRFLSRVNLSMSEAMVWLRFIPTPLKQWAEYVPAFMWD